MSVKLNFYILALLIGLALCEWQEKSDMNIADFEQESNNMQSQNFILASLCGYADNNIPKFVALWEKYRVRGDLIVKTNLTVDEFRLMSVPRYSALVPQYIEYGIVNICAYTINNVPYFSAIWERKPSHYFITQVHVSRSVLLSFINEYRVSKSQMRLLLINSYVVNGQDYYVAVWERNDALNDWLVHIAMSESEFDNYLNAYKYLGYRIKLVSSFDLNGITYYTALWDKPYLIEPLALEYKHSMALSVYKEELTSKQRERFRPRYISAFNSKSNVRFNVIWEKEADEEFSIKIIDDTVIEAMSKSLIFGLSLAITKNERLVYNKAYGRVDASIYEPLKIENSIKIASISKLFTTLSLIRLLEMGILKSLDQKVFGPDGILENKYQIPAYNYQNLTKITVESLMRHTSGIGSNYDRWDTLLVSKRTTFDELIQNILLFPSLFSANPESQRFEYSNEGYFLLGAIIEKLAGTSYDAFTRKHVLEPCNIGDSMFMGLPGGEAVTPMEMFLTSGSIQNYKIISSAGGYVATSQDLAKMLVRIDGLPNKPDIISKTNLDRIKKPTNEYFGAGTQLFGEYYGHTGVIYGGMFSMAKVYKNNITIAFIMSIPMVPFNAALFLDKEIDSIMTWPEYDLFEKDNGLTTQRTLLTSSFNVLKPGSSLIILLFLSLYYNF